MNRRIYRLCIVMLIVAAVISTVWYYQVFEKKDLQPKEGVFVWEDIQEGFDV